MPAPSGGALRLARAAELAWILPAPASYYGRAVRTACRRAGFEPRVAHEVTDTATSLAMVAAGLGVAPVTDLMLRLRSEGVTVVPLTDALERHLVVAVDAVARRRPPVAALIRALGEGAVPEGAVGFQEAGGPGAAAALPDAGGSGDAPQAPGADRTGGPADPPAPDGPDAPGAGSTDGAPPSPAPGAPQEIPGPGAEGRADRPTSTATSDGYERAAGPRAAATRPRTGA